MEAMSNDKEQILRLLREDFSRWEELLAGMSEEQITDRYLSSNMSIKDIVAHLWAWQQYSVARIEAALSDKEPELKGWPGGLDPDAEDDLDRINEWIYQTNRDRPWSNVYRDWREQFLRFVQLGEKVPEEELQDPQRYSWLHGYPLSAVLLGSYEHHEEHLGELLV